MLRAEFQVDRSAGEGLVIRTVPAANIQDQFLNYLRKEKVPVVVQLIGGEKIHGAIKGFDNFALIIQETGERLVYKHAIAAIVPEKPIQHFRELQESHPRAETRTEG